jgi:hypothetical protein
MLNRCYSQKDSLTAYYHRVKDVSYILILGCNVGYSYSGPHIPIDEVFTYKLTGDKIIRTFDADHSLRYRVDTLIVDKKSLRDADGLLLKKVGSKKRDELIEEFIQHSVDAGFYGVFLERLKSCKNDQ